MIKDILGGGLLDYSKKAECEEYRSGNYKSHA